MMSGRLDPQPTGMKEGDISQISETWGGFRVSTNY
jgi:hypothetical protein